ncbi:MAG: serine/threonine protein kinase [Polyangiaceae bacterium]|nr:serine/threonine protein kinase [Polyangiaceae bacterium]
MSMETQNCRVCGAKLGSGRFCHQCGAVVQVAPGADPLIGRVLNDRYRVLRVLGEGGMGVVYEGEQAIGGSSRRVAIKTLRDVHDSVLVARFYRECETLAGLAHPNTVRVYDFGETSDGVLFIVMEYVDGKSLSELLEDGPLAPARAAHIVRQIASALSEAHGQGVIHRDLKPDNIYVVRRGEREVVKLLDFGIARRCRPDGTTQDVKLTNDGSVLGTPAYMSPEQFTESTVDQHSDIYALAVITYELLTGEMPYGDANTPWEWASRHMSSEPVPLVTRGLTVDPAIETVIFKGLAKDPHKRPDTAIEFAEQFDAAIAGTLDTLEVPSSRGKRTGTEAMRATPGHTGLPTQASMGVPMAASPMAMPPLVFTPMPQERPRKRSKLPAILATLALALGGATLAVAMDQGLIDTSGETTVATQELAPAAQLTEVAPIEAEPPALEPELNQSIPEEPVSQAPVPRAPSRPAPAPAPTPEPTIPGVVLPLPIPTFTPPATSQPEPPPAPTPAPSSTPAPPKLEIPNLLKRIPRPSVKPSASPSSSAPAPTPAPSSTTPRLKRLPKLGN